MMFEHDDVCRWKKRYALRARKIASVIAWRLYTGFCLATWAIDPWNGIFSSFVFPKLAIMTVTCRYVLFVE